MSNISVVFEKLFSLFPSPPLTSICHSHSWWHQDGWWNRIKGVQQSVFRVPFGTLKWVGTVLRSWFCFRGVSTAISDRTESLDSKVIYLFLLPNAWSSPSSSEHPSRPLYEQFRTGCCDLQRRPLHLSLFQVSLAGDLAEISIPEISSKVYLKVRFSCYLLAL